MHTTYFLPPQQPKGKDVVEGLEGFPKAQELGVAESIQRRGPFLPLPWWY